jgi:hypothetical protein
MLVEGMPDRVLAFPGGRGTRNMVFQAKRAGVPVEEIRMTSALAVLACLVTTV